MSRLAVALGTAPTAGQAPAALPPGAFGNVCGTLTQAGLAAATLGDAALTGCSCRGTDGQTRTNGAGAFAAGQGDKVLQAGGVAGAVLTRPWPAPRQGADRHSRDKDGRGHENRRIAPCRGPAAALAGGG